ncbi:Soluble lytic murein transglycosylase-like protein [Hyella patelloides LEGE 07179]|uniref:Soluble lytic murein transglycosylase-like protein n=1 Tax=Hyella patelloides LEGE 07179 TaxID=945734 RepID=A0A563W194_9CYAN|nr:transglycosylase SLT domain-containing protein [Hyella patelloides]VEP17451.1 Soluble lytic murein transglycosylase-like protein [Hyella patelloides LEGE 07179]
MQKFFSSKTSLAVGIGLASSVIIGSIGSALHFRDRSDLSSSSVAVASNGSLENGRKILASASDLIEQNQGTQALQQLKNLEKNYPLLAPYILLKQGKAHNVTLEKAKAQAVWQRLIQEYPDSPAVAEALYLWGQENPVYWEQAIKQFPQHPRTHQIIRELLAKNPNQPKLMTILVKYDPDDRRNPQISDRLVAEYSSQLTPEDWAAIGNIYWLKWDYGKAGKAYAKAPRTPRNLYRAARGYHLGNSKQTAKNYYLQLINNYPNASETGLGLRRLASIVKKTEAIKYLDIAIANYPESAAEALLEKATILDALNSPVSAKQARELVLTQHKTSDAAAEYRWKIASKKAKQGDLVTAWQWAQPIAVHNPDHSFAPKASFWIGKWAQKLGRSEDATTAFQTTLTAFPRSYYAWRSAVALGWDVGDFSTVRNLQPQVVPSTQFVPPGGSDIFQELYQADLTEEAWGQFQMEISGKEELDVSEEFTQGLMRLHRGKNLRGINQIWFLSDRNHPEDRQQWQALKQTPQYWQSLYPFPYSDSILKWSQDRNLNPLLVTSLIRQESRFEPEIESSAGALGLMQVMPATGKSVAQQLGLQSYSLINPEDSIKIGTFYLDYTHKKYSNNSMLAVASYNAGPHKVAQWVNRYGLKDADEFVEKIPYRETKGYVESVFENYWNYMLVYNPEISKMLKNIQ